jgi:hypothetical protein
LPAIFAFAMAAVGGSVFLAYTSFSHDEGKSSAAASNDEPVYSVPAVPFDLRPEDPAQRAASIARALSATETQVHRAATIEEQETAPLSGPTLLADANRELRGFSGFSNFAGGGNNFLALAGTSFGISASTAPSYAAPDAETMTAAPVPEASTWMCGGALVVLVAVRGARASWRRKRRRE